MKVPRITVELTEREREEEKKYFGVNLPRNARARYEHIHALKVLERREALAAEKWEIREFPK